VRAGNPQPGFFVDPLLSFRFFPFLWRMLKKRRAADVGGWAAARSEILQGPVARVRGPALLRQNAVSQSSAP